MNNKKYHSGWNHFPIQYGKINEFDSINKLSKYFKKNKTSSIPVGNFKSYGDCVLNRNMAKYVGAKKIILNKLKKTTIVSSNVLIDDLIKKTMPYGFFPPVVPGTKYISIGGAIAADIHGKNHHINGSFCDHVIWFDIMISNGSVIRCSKTNNKELFRMTCGGMGLTGFIIRAKIKMIFVNSFSIKQISYVANNLSDLFQLFNDNQTKEYSVAWIDCTARGNSLGRGIMLLGEFAKGDDKTKYNQFSKNQKFGIPFYLPDYFMNRYTIRVFNSLYFSSFKDKQESIVDYDNYFFPLDKISHWNRLYGTSGFIQYQFVLPLDRSFSGLKTILTLIANYGKVSPLAVLKLLGPENKNYLSFPMKGYTLAVDFKNHPSIFPLLEKLDRIVNKNSGRIYLAKDSRVSKDQFEKNYKKIKDFRNYRKTDIQKNNITFCSKQSYRLGL